MKRDFKIKNGDNTPWFFQLRRIDTSCKEEEESHPHQHPFYQFLFFESGSGKHTIDGVVFDVKPQTLHFISPKHLHHLALEDGTQGFVCVFKDELFFAHNEGSNFLEEIEFFSSWNKHPVLEIVKPDFVELRSLLRMMKIEFEAHKMMKNEIILMHLKIVLLKASPLATRPLAIGKGVRNELMANFLGFLEELSNKNMPIVIVPIDYTLHLPI